MLDEEYYISISTNDAIFFKVVFSVVYFLLLILFLLATLLAMFSYVVYIHCNLYFLRGGELFRELNIDQ